MRKFRIIAYLIIFLMLSFFAISYYRYDQFVNKLYDYNLFFSINNSIERYFYLNNELPSSFLQIYPLLDFKNNIDINEFSLILNNNDSIIVVGNGFDRKFGNNIIEINYLSYILNGSGDFLIFAKRINTNYLTENLDEFLMFKKNKIFENDNLKKCVWTKYLKAREKYMKDLFYINETDSVFLLPDSYKTIVKISNLNIINYRVGNVDMDQFKLLFIDVQKCLKKDDFVVFTVVLPLNSEQFIIK